MVGFTTSPLFFGNLLELVGLTSCVIQRHTHSCVSKHKRKVQREYDSKLVGCPCEKKQLRTARCSQLGCSLQML